MKYLITGHNGFIGQTYIKHLLEKESASNILGLSRSKGLDRYDINEKIIELTDERLSEEIAAFAPDVIIHLASSRFGALENLFLSNVKATENLLNAVLKINKPVKIIIIGSSAEIGLPIKNPSSENDKCNPVDYYGLTKLMQSELAHQYYLKHNIEVIRLRLFNILGVGMPDSLLAGRAIKLFHETLISKDSQAIQFGDLSSYRDYLDKRDLCSAIDLSILHGKAGELYHIGSGIKTQGTHLINQIIATCPDKSYAFQYHFDSDKKSLVPHQIADVSKAKNDLRWEPSFSLNDTLTWMWNHLLISE